MNRVISPALIALSALLIALTTVFTLLVRVPVPATQGYVNLSDVAITFAGLIFGPWVGLAAGGIGAALAISSRPVRTPPSVGSCMACTGAVANASRAGATTLMPGSCSLRLRKNRRLLRGKRRPSQ